ncbi:MULTISPECIES: hypothetical protein [Thalassobaculum]|uniref:Lipoprotein n=1 Tax=Thalassobaculum litoreum DSM 18839 TaxID=1123362 RepID=A0A8G2BF76_9PROT|nr:MULTISPECIES: hypothetical protein [Thalassobaculum]SDF24762.1 hypothetical protein SAMN05660686_00732 [Thalassobaculum litoreum DSM 18839]
MRLDRRTLMISALAAAGVGSLPACTTPNPTPVYPDLTFVNRQPIRLNVGTLQIVDEVVPPMTAPNVEHLAPVAPAAAMERWARDVLQAGGSSGRAVMAIRQGSIVEERLKTTTGLKGAFTTDQSERYTVAMAGKLDLFDGAGIRLGQALAEAERSKTIAENASLNDRERLWYDLVEATARDFATAMERAIKRELAAYVY